MGLMDRFRTWQPQRPPAAPPPENERGEHGEIKPGVEASITFADRDITFKGCLAGYDYRAILRNKQRHILQLYELSDYYCDADPVFRGIIKEVYTPFSVSDGYRLVGANEKVKKRYLDYYERIGFRNFMEDVFLEFYKYANVVIYMMPNDRLIVLPIHLCRIGNISIDGEPVVEFHCRSVRDDLIKRTGQTFKQWVEDEDLNVRLSGYPPEVATAIKTEWREWVQLNPTNTFVMQDLKEGWMRYAVPMVAACLKAFEKKERISNYEDSLIDLAARSFVHVKYGDAKQEVLPDVGALNQVSKLFRSAMTGTALAVTNNWCSAEVIQPKTDDIFEYDKYKGVNSDILSAGGISGIIVSGHAEDGSTFASAQVSMQTAAMRIKQAKDSFCEMMDKVNRRLNARIGNTLHHSAKEQIPRFTFPPTDLSGSKAFQDTCFKLWQEGVLSHETLMQSYGLDMAQEVERKTREEVAGVHEILAPSEKDDCKEKGVSASGGASDGGERGRPTLDDEERHSDPSKSQTGRQPKPSNPEGSEAQET